ncbi:MAG: PadR family transcriptional regulator [Deltaproteobacteria bacterium]|nr:PadR family transcriptional regulator [Deltaproteobacteria bacterium]
MDLLILGLLIQNGAEMYGLQLVSESEGKVRRGTVYVTLGRMEEKGFVESRLEAVTNRPGLPRRLYRASALGARVHSSLRLAARRFAEQA